MQRLLFNVCTTVLLFFAACNKPDVTPGAKDTVPQKNTSTENLDTLLNVTYESGTVTSGLTGVTGSHATAADAAYMVSPGNTGNFAIAHKIVYGDSGYYSAGAFRSESDADYAPGARFLPGDERRYEFSVLLKDWPSWTNGDPVAESNLFQLKLTGPNGVPLQIRTTRNAMRVRYADASVLDIIPDFRPYVNQWIHFRINVLYASTATGYLRTYVKLPGAPDFTLKAEKTNYITYPGPGTGGQHGYIKWGLYIVPQNATRIAYHDDVRILKLR